MPMRLSDRPQLARQVPRTTMSRHLGHDLTGSERRKYRLPLRRSSQPSILRCQQIRSDSTGARVIGIADDLATIIDQIGGVEEHGLLVRTVSLDQGVEVVGDTLLP